MSEGGQAPAGELRAGRRPGVLRVLRAADAAHAAAGRRGHVAGDQLPRAGRGGGGGVGVGRGGGGVQEGGPPRPRPHAGQAQGAAARDPPEHQHLRHCLPGAELHN